MYAHALKYGIPSSKGIDSKLKLHLYLQWIILMAIRSAVTGWCIMGQDQKISQ